MCSKARKQNTKCVLPGNLLSLCFGVLCGSEYKAHPQKFFLFGLGILGPSNKFGKNTSQIHETCRSF